MVDVHVSKNRSHNDIAILLLPQSILLPARFLPALLAVDACGRDMTDQNGRHAAVSHKLELNTQPFELFVAGLVFIRASIDSGVGREEVPRMVSRGSVLRWRINLHGVQAHDGQLSRHNLCPEPAALGELMALGLWDEASPDVQILQGPPVGARGEDVMWHDVVVAKSGHDGYSEGVRGVVVSRGPPKDLGHLADHELVLLDDLVLGARNLLIVVVAGRVSGPDDKVDVVGDMAVYPVHGRVDQGDG